MKHSWSDPCASAEVATGIVSICRRAGCSVQRWNPRTNAGGKRYHGGERYRMNGGAWSKGVPACVEKCVAHAAELHALRLWRVVDPDDVIVVFESLLARAREQLLQAAGCEEQHAAIVKDLGDDISDQDMADRVSGLPDAAILSRNHRALAAEIDSFLTSFAAAIATAALKETITK